MKAKALAFQILILSLITAFVMLPTLKASPEKPKIYVYPEKNEFFTATTSVGYEFKVSIMAADWTAPGVFSYELKLYYDKTMLEAVRAEIPTGHWLTPTKKPTNIFIVDPGTINQEQGYVSFAATLLSPEEGKTGGGTMAEVTLKITKAPAAGENLTCPLELKDVILVNPEATEIPKDQYEIVNGVYIYAALAAPNTPPEASNLKITPAFPRTTDDLVASYTYFDADGDPESGSEIRWYKNGVLQEAFNDLLVVPANATSEGEEWYFTVRPKDGKAFGELKTSPKVTIGAVPAMKEDLNGDGKVNIEDIAIWGAAFGSRPGHPRWNPNADMNNDGKVDMIDAVLIAKAWTF
ncbi:MAG: dockerin type I domain-containing protein [Candidatus Bathyarchaeia archaeon]